MADVEPYGVMPYSEISELKKQVKKLQEKDAPDSEQLLKSVTGLTKGMDSMLQLFKTAADEMKLEEEEEKALSKQIEPLMNKLDEIIEQNKIIAEGMIAISDLVRERLPEGDSQSIDESPKFPKMPPRQNMLPPRQMAPPPLGQPPNMYGERPNMSPPMMPQQPRFPPQQNNNGLDLPPPPPVGDNKGFFGRK